MLVAERAKSGLTQVEVSSRLGKSQSFISKVELGERRIDVVELLDILACLEADPMRFFKSLLLAG
jgi:transcriptional regulator with XRE-family HTH domain